MSISTTLCSALILSDLLPPACDSCTTDSSRACVVPSSCDNNDGSICFNKETRRSSAEFPALNCKLLAMTAALSAPTTANCRSSSEAEAGGSSCLDDVTGLAAGIRCRRARTLLRSDSAISLVPAQKYFRDGATYRHRANTVVDSNLTMACLDSFSCLEFEARQEAGLALPPTTADSRSSYEAEAGRSPCLDDVTGAAI